MYGAESEMMCKTVQRKSQHSKPVRGRTGRTNVQMLRIWVGESIRLSIKCGQIGDFTGRAAAHIKLCTALADIK